MNQSSQSTFNFPQCEQGSYYNYEAKKCEKYKPYPAKCLGSVCVTKNESTGEMKGLATHDAWELKNSFEAYLKNASLGGEGNTMWFDFPEVKNAICTPDNLSKVQNYCSDQGSIPDYLQRNPQQLQYDMLGTMVDGCGWDKSLKNKCSMKGYQIYQQHSTHGTHLPSHQT